MDNTLNINHSFGSEAPAAPRPSVRSVHSFPFHTPRLCKCSVRSVWAIEHHAKDAGGLYLKTLDHHTVRAENTIHVYAPGAVYWEDTRATTFPIQETYLVFTGGEFCGLERFTDNEFRFARFLDPDAIVGTLLVKTAASCARLGDDAFWMAQSLFAETLFHLNRSVSVEGYTHRIPPIGEVEDKTFSQEVEHYLGRNIAKRVKLSEIAAYMKTSASLLSHKFKTEKGVSPIARLINMRIELAKNLLLKGEKLKTIAEMTGFCDEYQLSKTFKSVTGLSPRNFKNNS